MVLTLYVVLGLHRGYAAAGLVTAATTVGLALGSPLMGRLVDRRGVRHMVLLTCAAAGLFWFTAPLLPYPVLLGASAVAGLLQLPMFGVGRQAAVIDHLSPAWGYAIAGSAGLLLAAVGSLAGHRPHRPPAGGGESGLQRPGQGPAHRRAGAVARRSSRPPSARTTRPGCPGRSSPGSPPRQPGECLPGQPGGVSTRVPGQPQH
jgi:hypothetical protein